MSIPLRLCCRRIARPLKPLLGLNTIVSRHAADVAKPIMNRSITQDPLRVTYVDSTGQKKNEIMSRKDALLFAKSLNLDLILSMSVYHLQRLFLLMNMSHVVKADADPAVCKIADQKKLIHEKAEKAKEVKAKLKEVREIHIGVNNFYQFHFIIIIYTC